MKYLVLKLMCTLFFWVSEQNSPHGDYFAGHISLYPWTLGFVPLDARVCSLGEYFVLLFSPFFLIVSIEIKLHISFSTNKSFI